MLLLSVLLQPGVENYFMTRAELSMRREQIPFLMLVHEAEHKFALKYFSQFTVDLPLQSMRVLYKDYG